MSLYSKWIRQRLKDEYQRLQEEQEALNMRTLSEWLSSQKDNKPAIFIDQDETILSLNSSGTVPKKGEWAVKNAVFKELFGHSLAIIPRPHAADFLRECKTLAPTYILTAGLSMYQEQVLDSVGLLDYVEDVFGRDRFHDLPKGVKGILIDNLPHNSGNSSAKLQAMGGGMYLKVPDWTGENPHDNVLMDILPKIKQAFAQIAA
jgi:hypothetical protein